MALELHNFIWSEVRLIQVETQPHHIAGVLAEVNRVTRENDLNWEDVYSAYYECEADGTITFYEAESAKAGNPGIWTYVVYDCEEGEEEVSTKADLDTFRPALQLQQSLRVTSV
ncbi:MULTISPECIES: hypothetical protein [Cyanophyceae]|uniref:hypothetical protein n=1 Tax=Cyanophyceae TaxID=3028117 RepID=UPI00016DC3B7|nr:MULTISPECIES: hypothetical protein [Cyanophyceae]ACB01077.1 conserved hypothetical protein [Picosynechococcus sp. PCC 7002]SMH47652.1 hypothetical protein SAMN06272755_1808 [Picosynechococcus sp. OG1]SMQ81055.1 hypothetical protein SAMN06272774_1087 [Synechococcus sp. 7002]